MKYAVWLWYFIKALIQFYITSSTNHLQNAHAKKTYFLFDDLKRTLTKYTNWLNFMFVQLYDNNQIHGLKLNECWHTLSIVYMDDSFVLVEIVLTTNEHHAIMISLTLQYKVYIHTEIIRLHRYTKSILTLFRIWIEFSIGFSWNGATLAAHTLSCLNGRQNIILILPKIYFSLSTKMKCLNLTYFPSQILLLYLTNILFYFFSVFRFEWFRSLISN